MVISTRVSRRLLTAIILTYLMIGSLYALETPRWQVPDEPAHFNYIEYVALQNELPVLEEGDYPHQYLEEIKQARFPAHMSIAPIRYESWQPPLYYSLAAVIYRVTARWPFDLRFLSLRLFSVALGALAVWVTYRLAHDIFPNDEFLALAAAAFAATIPMHLAILAGIGNDALAELMLLLILWQSIHITRSGLDLQRGVVTGMILGLAFLTKTTIYIGAAVVLVAVLLHREPGQGSWLDRAARTLGPFIGVLVVAVLFVAPWLLRNAQVYGDLDLLAWQRHDAVVAGQLRTADLIVEIGWAGLLKRFALTTFRSFWAQFGWMGVLVDERIYLSLALLSALLGLGLVLFAVRAWLGVRWPETQGRITLTETQGRALALLGISLLLSVVLYLGYNVKFVQHQGRYLFPALGPVAVAVALSVRELLRPNAARAVAVVLLLASALLVAFGVLSEGIPAWSLALLLAACGFLASVARLPARWQWLAPASLYVALIVLDLVSLYGYLVPGTEILTSG